MLPKQSHMAPGLFNLLKSLAILTLKVVNCCRLVPLFCCQSCPKSQRLLPLVAKGCRLVPPVHRINKKASKNSISLTLQNFANQQFERWLLFCKLRENGCQLIRREFPKRFDCLLDAIGCFRA